MPRANDQETLTEVYNSLRSLLQRNRLNRIRCRLFDDNASGSCVSSAIISSNSSNSSSSSSNVISSSSSSNDNSSSPNSCVSPCSKIASPPAAIIAAASTSTSASSKTPSPSSKLSPSSVSVASTERSVKSLLAHVAELKQRLGCRFAQSEMVAELLSEHDALAKFYEDCERRATRLRSSKVFPDPRRLRCGVKCYTEGVIESALLKNATPHELNDEFGNALSTAHVLRALKKILRFAGYQTANNPCGVCFLRDRTSNVGKNPRRRGRGYANRAASACDKSFVQLAMESRFLCDANDDKLVHFKQLIKCYAMVQHAAGSKDASEQAFSKMFVDNDRFCFTPCSYEQTGMPSEQTSDLHEFYKRCLLELDRLEEVRLKPADVSLCAVLRNDDRQIARFARMRGESEQLDDLLAEHAAAANRNVRDANFAIYKELVRQRFFVAVCRRDSLRRLRKDLAKAFNHRVDEDHIVIDRIVDFLSDVDIKHLASV